MRRTWHRVSELIPPGTRLVLGLLSTGALATCIGARTGFYDLNELLGLNGPAFWSGHVWQIVTYALLPVSLWNFLMNGLMIALLSQSLERIWSRRELWSYCVVVIVGAGAAKIVLQFSLPSLLAGSAPLGLGLLAAWAFLFRGENVSLPGLGEITVGLLAAVAGAIDFALICYSSGLVDAVVALAGPLSGLLYLVLQARMIATRPSRVVHSDRVNRLEL